MKNLFNKILLFICLIFALFQVKQRHKCSNISSPTNSRRKQTETSSIRFMQSSIENHLVSQCITDMLSDENPNTSSCKKDVKKHMMTPSLMQILDPMDIQMMKNSQVISTKDRGRFGTKRVIENFRNHRTFIIHAATRKLPPSIDLGPWDKSLVISTEK